MKLQAKFTINFIFLVLVTIFLSFFLIHWNFESQFSHFIQEKNQQWQNIVKMRGNNHPGEMIMIMENPFENPRPGNPKNLLTPEQNFLKTVSNSLIWAAIIDIILAIILGYVLSSFLLRRIFTLKSAMNNYMTDGQMKMVSHEDKDEVDELAKIYNLLIEKIKKEEQIRKDFFIDMSHELRTPLTSVKGYLEGLLDNVFSDEKDIHKKTLAETERMIRLVNEMTVLAKLETENIELQKEGVDLRGLTEKVIEGFKKDLESKNSEVEISGEANLIADPHKLQQVITNLIDNAIQYGKPGNKIFVEIGTENTTVFWKIKNKAVNIKSVEINSFFERFYRSDKSRKYDYNKQHLGIGLNIVKKIVEQHNGKISAQLDGDYIQFSVELPLPNKL